MVVSWFESGLKIGGDDWCKNLFLIEDQMLNHNRHSI